MPGEKMIDTMASTASRCVVAARMLLSSSSSAADLRAWRHAGLGLSQMLSRAGGNLQESQLCCGLDCDAKETGVHTQ